MKVGEFKKLVSEVLSEHPEYRYGQAVFNLMYEYFPERANRCRSTQLDPFYNDKMAEAFINFCLVEWRG